MTRITQKPAPPVSTPTTTSPSKPQAAPGEAPRGWSAGTAKAGAAQGVGDSSAAAATRTAETFYAGLASRDLSAMGWCYDKNVKFHDPLFRSLDGAREVMDMWKTIMPAANPATFKIEPKVLPEPKQNADGSWDVKVHWDAHYDLGARHVDNHADSTLTIKDGKIIAQRDEWDLGAWMKQALPVGGGSKVVAQAASLAAHSFVELKALFEELGNR